MQDDNQQQAADAYQYATVGKWVKKARREKGLKQKELAQRVQIDPKYLSAIENGHRQGSLKLISRIGKELGQPLSYFYQDNLEIISDVELDEEIARKLDQCSKYKKMLFNNILDALVSSPEPPQQSEKA